MSWRTVAAQTVFKVIQSNPDAKPEELRKLISAAYPFGERKYHPYKIWLDEIKRQTGTKAQPKPPADLHTRTAFWSALRHLEAGPLPLERVVDRCEEMRAATVFLYLEEAKLYGLTELAGRNYQLTETGKEWMERIEK